MSEVIKHAAVKSNCGMVLIGKCHAHCFQQGANTGLDMSPKADDQGFFTSFGRYVDRKEAATIAVKAGQVRPLIGVLFSEDLWSESIGGKFKYDNIKGYYEL